MNIQTGITVEVFPDSEYRYEVSVNDELISLNYFEEGQEREIAFGSLDELEAVANAMLKVAKFYKS